MCVNQSLSFYVCEPAKESLLKNTCRSQSWKTFKKKKKKKKKKNQEFPGWQLAVGCLTCQKDGPREDNIFGAHDFYPKKWFCLPLGSFFYFILRSPEPLCEEPNKAEAKKFGAERSNVEFFRAGRSPEQPIFVFYLIYFFSERGGAPEQDFFALAGAWIFLFFVLERSKIARSGAPGPMSLPIFFLFLNLLQAKVFSPWASSSPCRAAGRPRWQSVLGGRQSLCWAAGRPQ